MKRFSLLLAILLFCLWPVPKPVRAGTAKVNQSLTITAGTPVRVALAGTMADEILIQPQPGGTVGLVYVMAGIYGRTPSTSKGTDVTAVLCAATSTLPGCPYTDGTSVSQSTPVDAGSIWVDVATTGTVVIVTYAPR